MNGWMDTFGFSFFFILILICFFVVFLDVRLLSKKYFYIFLFSNILFIIYFEKRFKTYAIKLLVSFLKPVPGGCRVPYQTIALIAGIKQKSTSLSVMIFFLLYCFSLFICFLYFFSQTSSTIFSASKRFGYSCFFF